MLGGTSTNGNKRTVLIAVWHSRRVSDPALHPGNFISFAPLDRLVSLRLSVFVPHLSFVGFLGQPQVAIDGAVTRVCSKANLL